MSKCVLDASALIALINSEPGAELVEGLLPLSIMSAVNVAEVVAELEKSLGITPKESRQMIDHLINQVVAFDFDQAIEAGSLRKHTQTHGLSVGDRACLALAISNNCPVYTADKIWAKLKIDCDVVIIR